MGIGFVIIIFIFVLGLLSFLGTLFLAAFAWILLWNSPKTVKKIAIHKAPVLPAVSAIIVFTGYIIYAITCVTIRDVDPGIGDAFRVPLGSGYSLNMIDVSEQSFIESPSGENLGFGFKKISYDDKTISLKLKDNNYYFIDKSRNKNFTNLTLDQLNRELKLSGAKAANFLTVDQAYNNLRWTIFDLISAVIIFAVPFILFILFMAHLIKLKMNIKDKSNPGS